MTATPDSFSMAQLQELLDNAPAEEEVKEVTSFDPDDCSVETITNIAAKSLDAVMDKLSSKQACMVEKVMLHMITQRMIEWHSRVAFAQAEDDDNSASLGWGRDAGKFQAILCILNTIQVSDDDFTQTVS